MAVSRAFLEKQKKAIQTQRELEKDERTKTFLVKAEEVLEEFDLDDFEELGKNHKRQNSLVKGTGCLTIVYHEKCGRRIHISNKIWKKSGCPPYFKLFIRGSKLIVVPSNNTGIPVKFDRTIDFAEAVKSYNSKIVLYAADVAKSLADAWGLAFDDFCCHTCGEFKECLVNGVPAIVITNEDFQVEAEETEVEVEEAEVENTEVENTEVEDTEVEDTEADETQSEN